MSDFRSGKSLTTRGGSQITSNPSMTIQVSPAAARFLNKVSAPPPPPQNLGLRFLIAFDATASREPTWREAQKIQSELFRLMTESGVKPNVRLSHFGGNNFSATEWVNDIGYLTSHMNSVKCAAGQTQISEVLEDAIRHARLGKIAAVIYTGDCMEERGADLCDQARRLRELGTPVYMFQEGDDPTATRTYKEIAALSGGAYATFGAGAFNDLRSLFKVVVAAHSNNPALQLAVRKDNSITGPARMLLANLSNK